MKSLRYLLALVVIFSMSGVTSRALADPVRTVLVTNNTSYTVTAFYASPSDEGGWDTEDNLLGGQTIASGQTTTVSIPGDDCTYDLMAILYGVAQYAYQYQVAACGGGSWTISVPY